MGRNKSTMRKRAPITEETRQNLKIAQLGEKHHRWNDTTPSYTTVHMWLNFHFRKEKVKCEQCGEGKNLQFALKHGESHSHNRKKYIILCKECHYAYDRKIRSDKISKSKKGKKLRPQTFEHRQKISMELRKWWKLKIKKQQCL